MLDSFCLGYICLVQRLQMHMITKVLTLTAESMLSKRVVWWSLPFIPYLFYFSSAFAYLCSNKVMISTAVYTVFTSISLTTIAFNHIIITGHLSWHLFYLGFPILPYFLIHKVHCLLLSYIEFLDIFWVCIS